MGAGRNLERPSALPWRIGGEAMTRTVKAQQIRVRSISALRRAADAAGYAAACAPDDLEAQSGRFAFLLAKPAAAVFELTAAVALAIASYRRWALRALIHRR